MSFILDALKKSELERQRQSMPGLIEVPVAARRRGIPVWVWVLAGLLGINVAVLLVLLLHGAAHAPAIDDAPAAREASATRERVRDLPARAAANRDPDSASADSPAAAADERAPAADHFSPLDSQPVYAPEIPVQDAGQTGAAPAQRGTAPAHAARRADPQLVDEPADNDEMLPSISELNLTGTQALPEIHLDVHVYATRTADRFVYINMRKYREGAVLQEGPTLERIRRDGVVLSYNGLRFLVPRQ